MSRLNRRNFIAAFTSGVVGLGLPKSIKAETTKLASLQNQTSTPRIRKFNLLGTTGLKISDVSCGAISLFEPNVLRYAYECGVNYFDTAEGYLRMKGEVYVSQGLKEVRDKVIITTKHPYDFDQKIDKASILRRVEASLKRLQTDTVDIAMVHNISDLSPLLQSEEMLSAYAQLKQEGKIRFTGFSTHNPKLTLRQALETDFAQVILFIYSHMEGREIEPLIKAVRQKGIGTVAMKIFAGGMQDNLKAFISPEVSYSQAAIRWVMTNPDVDCCIPTMSSYSHVEEYVAASGQSLKRADLNAIASYRKQAGPLYCRVSCQKCLPACPHQVAINEVLRYAMYFENYKMEKDAVSHYADLDNSRKPLICSSCSGYCESSCPYGLKIKQRLIHSHEILTG
ncbi:MAG: aldo/keto reductase [Candidatus Aminicenantales bacterium]